MKIKLKNGSTIESIDTNEEPLRSIARMLVEYRLARPSDVYYYLTGKRLHWYQRIWLDKILPIFDRRFRWRRKEQ